LQPGRHRPTQSFLRLAVPVLATAGIGLPQEFSPPETETRTAIFAALQKAKVGKAKPYELNKAEKAIRKFEAVFLLDPSGFYPYFGSVYHGGSLTGGAGYRLFIGDNTNWHVQGLYSALNYKLIETGIESRDHLHRRLSFGTRLGWRDATQVPFYGLGTNSDQQNRTNFRFQQTYADGHAMLRPIRWILLKGNLGYERWELLQGKGAAPSIETRHTARSAPGLGADPSYVHSQVSAGIDWRRSPGYTRNGGLYEVAVHDYHNTNGGAYSFRKLTGEVIQHVPLLRETWVLAARGRVETTLNDADVIPYFLLPALGSGNTLRAYSADRFRDRHSMLMNAEFRWLPNIGMDFAFFYDAGKVTSVRNDLGFRGLKSDVGVGVRFHGLVSTPLRIDLAVGSEGWRLVLAGGQAF